MHIIIVIKFHFLPYRPRWFKVFYLNICYQVFYLLKRFLVFLFRDENALCILLVHESVDELYQTHRSIPTKNLTVCHRVSHWIDPRATSLYIGNPPRIIYRQGRTAFLGLSDSWRHPDTDGRRSPLRLYSRLRAFFLV